MRRLLKSKSTAEKTDFIPPGVEAGLKDLADKIYEKVSALENKIDTLISRSGESIAGSNRFQKYGREFSRPDRYSGQNRDDRPRERNFSKAVCAECGKDCEVPFRPTGGRPVYCSDCFSARKEPGTFKPKFGNKSREGGFSRDRGFGKKRGSFFQRRKEH